MIQKYKYDDSLPISVIIPHSQNRKYFFEEFVLPSIESNCPAEIIINDNEGLAPKKRMDGFKESTQEFIIYSDNDCVYPQSFLQKYYDCLINNPEISFTYSGYKGIVLNPQTHPMRGNFEIPTIEYDSQRLRQGNYISTMTLIRREAFIDSGGFDLNLKRLQDWDLWLTMSEKGYKGKAVFNNEFFAFYLDEGITSNGNNENEAYMAVARKHKLY